MRLADEGVRKHHDELIEGIHNDLKGVLRNYQAGFQDNFRQIHTHAEQSLALLSSLLNNTRGSSH